MKKILKNKKWANNYLKYYSVFRIVWEFAAILIFLVLNSYCQSITTCVCNNPNALFYGFAKTYVVANIYLYLPIATLLFIIAEVINSIIAFTDEIEVKKINLMIMFSIAFITSFVVILLLSSVMISSSPYLLPAVIISLVLEIINLNILYKMKDGIEDEKQVTRE